MTRSAQKYWTRRDVLKTAAASAVSLLGGSALLGPGALLAGPAKNRRPRVAAIFTELRFRSHAYNILENFFEPYLFRGELVDPGCEVVSFYADQFPQDDMARDVAQKFDIPLYKTIDEALCRGGKELDVDAVLLIGEHGEYPFNELGQHMYPRKQFFDQITTVMKRSDRWVPLFNDKHLSYRWDWAREMYDTARQHKMPLLAGSSVTLGQRRPSLDLPKEAEFETVVAVHGGGLESYGFHGLELLQSFVEARRGGESGIARVELFTGEAIQKAADEGLWSPELRDAAMAAERAMHAQRMERPTAGRPSPAPEDAKDKPARPEKTNHVIRVTYRDGLSAAVVQVGGDSNRWNFACRLKGENENRATAIFNGPWGNRCFFKALSHAIQHLFIEGREPYPVERTLLVTGALEAVMQANQSGRPVDTPHLDIAYQPVDFSRFRETGASWKRLTIDSPQPTGFEPGDESLIRG